MYCRINERSLEDDVMLGTGAAVFKLFEVKMS